MIAVLRRIPWWAYLALAALVYAGVQEHRIRSLQATVDGAKLGDLAKERAAVTADRQALQEDRGRLLGSIEALRAQSRVLEGRLATLSADLGRQEAAGKRLVESGTVDDVVRFGQQLGLHPVAR